MNHTILIADDDQLCRLVVAQVLRDHGFRVVTAADGEQTLAQARQHRPALVLLDIHMPGLDGYTVCRALKADPQTRQSVVVFYSAWSRETDRIAGVEAGADDYVDKTAPLRNLAARLERALRVRVAA